MNVPRLGPRSLDPAVEVVWDRIRAEFALQEGFWLGLLFGGEATDLTELIARSRDLASSRVRRMEVQLLHGVDDVAGALGALLTSAPAEVAGTWMIDQGGSTPDRTRLWVELLRRLNERRDAVRARRPGALLLACPPGLLTTVRDEAPDLWSFRTLTATLERAPARTAVEVGSPIEVPARSDALTPVFGEPIQPSAMVGVLLRRAAGALRSNRVNQALAAAADALSAAEKSDDAVLAQAWLAQARVADDEPTEAARHAEAALRAGRPLEEATTVALLEILTGVIDHELALEAAAALVTARRELVRRHDESPTALRDLSVSLDNVAGVQQARGNLDAALTGYTESLDLARRIHTTYGDTPEALRDLSVSHQYVARVQEERGELGAALTAHREAERVIEWLRDRFGPPYWTPALAQVTTDALDRLGSDGVSGNPGVAPSAM
ncbi:MAG: tetratricopeptide repeat protein [Pseudonocardia sp.]